MKTILTILLLTLLKLSITSACDCQPLGPPNATSHIVTRLWNINPSSNLTDQDVINEFDEGFAPIVTRMQGFQRYTSSSTGNASTVFFMNAFDTREHAGAAQAAAKDFVVNGVLKDVITPNTFTEDEVVISFANDECITESSVGKFLKTRVFQYDGDYIRPDDELEVFASINNIASTTEGYEMLAMTRSEEDERPIIDFRYDIYDTKEGATAIHNIMAPLVANNTFGAVTSFENLRVYTEGAIAFDYMCVLPDDFPEEGKAYNHTEWQEWASKQNQDDEDMSCDDISCEDSCGPDSCEADESCEYCTTEEGCVPTCTAGGFAEGGEVCAGYKCVADLANKAAALGNLCPGIFLALTLTLAL